MQTVDLNPHYMVKMHIHDSALAGINRSAANGRISAAVADQCGEVDAGKVSIQIPNVGFLLLTGYAVGFPISDDAGTSSSSGATVSLSGDVAAVCCYARTNHSRTAHKTIDHKLPWFG